MAQQTSRRSAHRGPVYRINGSAAYDIHYRPYEDGKAAREVREPVRRPKPKAKPCVRAKLTIAPMAIMGMLAAACMLVFVLCGYVQLYEQTAYVSELETQLEEVQARNARLQSTYDNKIDLNVIEEKALALGMTLPNNKQTIYLDLEGSDKAVILETEEDNVVGTAWQAIVRSVQTLREYFS